MQRLIDDRGNLWDAASWHLRSTLHLTGVKGDVSAALICKLGFIGLRWTREGTIVRFNPATMSEVAFAALLNWLLDSTCQRVCLTLCQPNALDRIYFLGSVRAAIDRMDKLVFDERMRRDELPFHQELGELESLPASSVFAAAFETWRSTAGVFSEAYYAALDCVGERRYVMLTPRSDAGSFEILETGSGLQIPDPQARSSLIGSMLGDIPDHAYGRWVSRDYREALTSQRARFDHVTADIFWPRTGRVRRRYSRLILPCRTPGAQQLLLGVSGPYAGPTLHVEAS